MILIGLNNYLDVIHLKIKRKIASFVNDDSKIISFINYM